MKPIRSLIFGTLCLALGSLAVPHAHAQVGVYTDPATYDAASTGNTTYAFTAGASDDVDESPSYTFGPLTFAATGLDLFNDGGYGDGVTYLGAEVSEETITLGGATALSFTLGTYGEADTVAISINGVAATTLTETARNPSTMFIGFTDTVPITSLTFSNTTFPGDEIDVINFQTNAVPEPSTWALLGLGAAGAGIVTLRRRRVRA